MAVALIRRLGWLFEHLTELLEQLPIILELPDFIRRFYGILEHFTFY